jgi:hypothetical protein
MTSIFSFIPIFDSILQFVTVIFITFYICYGVKVYHYLIICLFDLAMLLLCLTIISYFIYILSFISNTLH